MVIFMAGRNDAYEEKIVPAFATIKKYLESGMPERDVAEKIGISQATWFKYKSKNDEFRDFIRSCRRKPIMEVENALMLRALGYTRTTQKTARVKFVEYDPKTGKKVREGEQIVPYTVEEDVPADVTAGIFLLTNWTRGEYARDAAMVELRKKEFEFKKENGSW